MYSKWYYSYKIFFFALTHVTYTFYCFFLLCIDFIYRTGISNGFPLDRLPLIPSSKYFCMSPPHLRRRLVEVVGPVCGISWHQIPCIDCIISPSYNSSYNCWPLDKRSHSCANVTSCLHVHVNVRNSWWPGSYDVYLGLRLSANLSQKYFQIIQLTKTRV